MGAGRLDRRFRFEIREDVDDGAGNTKGDWAPQFTVWGALAFLRGGEGVIAGRLEGRSPAILTVWRSASTLRIGADWRCVEVATDRVFAVREDPRETVDRAQLELLVESGVAA